MSDDDGWDNDDEDDLFSFGVDSASPEDALPTPQEAPAKPAVTETSPRERRGSTGSDDSFLDLLDENKADENVLTGTPIKMDDAETQEILSWLDEEGETVESGTSSPAVSTPSTVDVVAKGDGDKKEEASLSGSELTTPEKMDSPVADVDEQVKTETPPPTTATPKEEPKPGEPTATTPEPEPVPTLVELPPVKENESPSPPPAPTFNNLEEALESTQSTSTDLREMFAKDGMRLASAEMRPNLWCRIIGGKKVDDLMHSSMADSFQQWQGAYEEKDDERTRFIKDESAILAERIFTCTDMPLEEAKQGLESVLLFYCQSQEQSDMDPLLPPVVCAILSAGIPPVAASVVLSKIIPSVMPLLALSKLERMVAARSLHTQFYLLACYHLPLLVFHLDRYAPGWHWPKQLTSKDKDESVTEKGRNLEGQGVVPQSWLISHLAGECSGTLMNPKWLLSLWDLILTSSNNSLRFFLSLALLEKHSDTLLMLTGDQLIQELHRIMEFKEGTTLEGFAIAGDEETSESEAGDWVQDWCSRARSLWESTPRSVVSRLRVAEDRAVEQALQERQRVAEEKLQARLEEEARIHRETQQAERERKAEENRKRMNRARLIAYYRKFNPEKEDSVDTIMETFDGRLDVLDTKLKTKYGQGFHPVLKPAPISKTTNKFLSTMNQGFTNRRKQFVQNRKARNAAGGSKSDKDHSVAVRVSVTEVLPVICWTKEAAAAKTAKALDRGNDSIVPLKFYLVDSRPDDTVQAEGRFPTSLAMSPEALLDPDRIQQNEEMFESLRGAVHIVVMGEGFSALPRLYGQKMNPKLQQLVDEDQTRTSLCALFFVKKGFPFVSTLDGGFASAHAWLEREGPSRHLDARSALVDYGGEDSLFGQLEKAYKEQQALASASTAERTQHAMQSFLDNSMTSLTRHANRLEGMAARNSARIDNFALDLENREGRQKVQGSVKNFFANPEPLKVTEVALTTSSDADEQTTKEPSRTVSKPQGAFARLAKVASAPPDKEVSIKSEDESDASKKNPLGGFGAALNKTLKPTESKDGGMLPASKPADGVEAPKKNPLAGFGAALNKTLKSNESTGVEAASRATDGTEGQRKNRFAGIGAAFNKTLKANEPTDETKVTPKNPPQMPGVLKQNPFARFNKPTPEAGSGATQKRFGGININQLRSRTMQTVTNLRTQGSDLATAKSRAEEEEAISFMDTEEPPSDLEFAEALETGAKVQMTEETPAATEGESPTNAVTATAPPIVDHSTEQQPEVTKV